MKKRNLPPHIVLPSGMWRFVKKGKTIKRKKIKGVRTMARKRKSHSKRSGGLNLKHGIIPVSGLLAGALIGAGAATLADNAGLSAKVPFGKYVAGGAVAGLPGIAGVFLRDMIKGTTSSGMSGSVY